MTLAIVLVCLALLTVGTVLVARARARVSPEDLNMHSIGERDLVDRPAGPGAERMTEEPPEGAEDV